ncbi:MAG: DivIVA domain-containing protein [Alphaproteobacteria bacterium]|nr:DivIVA domain-containing protein [Alphaproteobacteria bacterium]MCB9792368.1 DivIVA domain-containing protein [Alphaproteobacteria bacterium]
MPITPLDIIQRMESGFAYNRRGYDPDEVRVFLDDLRETLEETLEAKRRLAEALERRELQIEALKAEQAEIKDTLLLARRFSEELSANARREADLVIGEARLEAQQIIAGIHEEHLLLSQDVHHLRAQRHRLVSELRAVIESHGRLLSDLDRLTPQES